MTESRAIQMAIGIVKNPPAAWGPEAKAAAAKAAAEWRAKKGAVSKPSASSKARGLAESVSLGIADQIVLRRAARGRLEAIEEVLGAAGIGALAEARESGSCDARVAALGEMIEFDLMTLEMLEERVGFHAFDALKHPRGFHGRFSGEGRAARRSASASPLRGSRAAHLHNADAHLVRAWRASNERVKVHAADHILHKTTGMSTEAANDALQSGRIKDTLTQHAPAGRIHPDREKLHFKIIQHFLEGTEPQKNPEAMFTAGGSASGKTSLVQFAPDGHVIVNPDLIREMLPEYKELKEKGRPDIASSATHEEASHIASRLASIAIETKRHVVIDGVGDSAKGKFAGKIARARDAGHKTSVRYAHVPTKVAEQRNLERFEKTGRLVPPNVLREKHAEVSQRYQEVRQLHGVEVFVHHTAGPEGVPPPLISLHSAGRLKVTSWAKQRQFEAKAREGGTSAG